ncbi:hypothetical protein, partial [Frankia sp. ACN1ag]|uniref:hypothetical protein n=1 Tax=Frankia sp. ACN1ag TaxID=102891 RepID=UPI001F3EF45A
MEVAAFSEGIRRYEDRDYEMAAGFFRVALDEDPRNLRARLHLAACLHNSGQSEHAFDVAFGGRAFHLTSPALAEVLATLYEARELLPEAIDCLDTAIEGMPHKFEYSIRKAGLLVKLGLHDDARHTLLRSIASNGYQTELVLQLCDTWIDEHDYIRARGVLERCPDSVRADQKREKIYTLERTYEFPMSLDDLEFWRPIHAIRIGNPARRKKFISAYTDVARHLNAIATTTPAAERLRIRVRMKNVAEAEYRARKVMDLTSNLVFWIIFIAGGIALLRFPYILPSINHSLGSPSFKHYVISYGGSIAVGYTLLTILAASPGRHRYLLSFLLSGYVVAIYDLAYRLQFSSVDLSIRFGVAAGLTFVSFAMTISAAGSLLERLARRSFVKRLQDRYPEEYSLLSLLNSLLAVQRAKSPRQELQSPGYLASTIEDAAIK